MKSPAEPKQAPIYRALKRVFDICMSALLMLILWPLGAALAIMIVLDSKGSPIYAQNRIGLNKRHIRLYKFRSMVSNADALKSNFTPEQRAYVGHNRRVHAHVAQPYRGIQHTRQIVVERKYVQRDICLCARLVA